MEDLTNSNILAKWAAGELPEEKKQALEKENNLKDLSIVLTDINHWSLPELNTAQKFDELKQGYFTQQKKKGKSAKLSIWTTIAASFILLCSISYFLLHHNAQVVLTTQEGETVKHTLPKGSTITIDAKSTAKYSKWRWRKSREISLDGQAFFNVTKGVPFKVKTAMGTVEVLGTKFNINTNEQQFKVYCYRGTVKVKSGDVTKILNQQQGVIIENNEVTEVNVEGEMPDWTNGFTKYDAVVLSDVIKDLNKYYNLHIDLPDQYQHLVYSGILVHNDLKTALEMVFDSMGISYKLTDKNNVIFE